MYVFARDPDFDVSTGKYSKLPVWIEIPYRSLTFGTLQDEAGQGTGASSPLSARRRTQLLSARQSMHTLGS